MKLEILNRLEDLFESRPMALKVLKSLGLLFSERVLRIFIGFFVTAWVVNHLGPKDYGKLVYVIQYVLIFVPVVTFGLGEIISRDIVESIHSEGEVLGTSSFLKLLNSIIGMFIIGVSVLISDISVEEKKLILVLSTLLIGHVFYNIAYWYEAKMEYRKLVLGRNLGYLLSIGLKVSFILLELPFEYFMYAYFIEMLFAISFCFITYVKMKGVNHWRVNKNLLKKYYIEGFPLFFVAAFLVVEQKVGIFMIENFEGASELGQYSLAFTIFTTLSFIPQAIMTTLFPTLVKSKERSLEFYSTRMIKLYCVLLWASIVLSIGTYLIGGEFLTLIFGEKYIMAIEIIKVMTVYCIFIFFDAARRKVLVLEEKGGDYLKYVAVNVSLVILFQYFLIPKYSVFGAVYGAILAFITSNIIISVLNKNIRSTLKFFFLGLAYPVTRLMNRPKNKS